MKLSLHCNGRNGNDPAAGVLVGVVAGDAEAFRVFPAYPRSSRTPTMATVTGVEMGLLRRALHLYIFALSEPGRPQDLGRFAVPP
jgi:hypothetical protein